MASDLCKLFLRLIVQRQGVDIEVVCQREVGIIMVVRLVGHERRKLPYFLHRGYLRKVEYSEYIKLMYMLLQQWLLLTRTEA